MKRGLSKKVGATEELNGLELWRRLYVDSEGGAVEVEIQDSDCFLRFPECKDIRHLNEYLNTWESMAAQHGAHLPDQHLQSMLKNNLPTATRLEVRKWATDHPWATTRDLL